MSVVIDQSILDAMRSDWNERAQEDANYYVAFGRRNQHEEEFVASAADQVRLFEAELKRLPADRWGQGAALEIGCGPGRLLRPLSRHFRQIHGLDISEVMLQRAETALKGITNHRLHHTRESNLTQFTDESIDFVYSYAVFQHIPSKQVVFNYLSDAVRVIRPGGLIVFQVNGLRDSGYAPNTWDGCRITAEEVIHFARVNRLLLLALTDRDTQYMWVTLQRREIIEPQPEHAPVSIYKVSQAHSGEPVVPAGGRFGEAWLGVTHLPSSADLLTLSAKVDGAGALCTYISPVVNGRRFVSIVMPPGTRTGLVPIALLWNGSPLAQEALARVIPAAPRIASVTRIGDGLNRLLVNRIESGWAKLTMDEIEDPSRLRLSIAGAALTYDWLCVDPVHERYEFNFQLPRDIAPGAHRIELAVGHKRFVPLTVDIVDPVQS